MKDYCKMRLLLLCLLWFSASCSQGTAEGFPANEMEIPAGASAEEASLELFHRWMVKHGKVYTRPKEKAVRYANFLRNLEFVIRMRNAGRTTASFARSPGPAVGLNVFADLSNEEFKEMHSSRALKRKAAQERAARKRLAERAPEGRVATCDDAPASLDWRKRGAVTAVKDQGECGSCWAFSSTGGMEGINAIATGELISLSEQELVDCDTTNDGCDGGYMDYAFEWVINNGGIDTEQNYPYTGVGGVCNTTKGIYKGKYCSSNPDDIDHAVLVVGYGRDGGVDFWIVKNSWGTDWGMQGYVYIERNATLPYGVCAINAMASYPTKQSSLVAPSTASVVPSYSTHLILPRRRPS